jgi:hypothetical protein
MAPMRFRPHKPHSCDRTTFQNNKHTNKTPFYNSLSSVGMEFLTELRRNEKIVNSVALNLFFWGTGGPFAVICGL